MGFPTITNSNFLEQKESGIDMPYTKDKKTNTKQGFEKNYLKFLSSLKDQIRAHLIVRFSLTTLAHKNSFPECLWHVLSALPILVPDYTLPCILPSLLFVLKIHLLNPILSFSRANDLSVLKNSSLTKNSLIIFHNRLMSSLKYRRKKL